MNKEMVVVVDQEAKKNLKSLGGRYFGIEDRIDGSFKIENPLGKVEELAGSLIRRPSINYHSSEYLYLEVTNKCNFSCIGCGVGNGIQHLPIENIISGRNGYITDDFLNAIVSELSSYPAGLKFGERRMYYGGGEPLINPERFAEINQEFANIPKTIRHVITNGCSIPLDSDEFRDYANLIQIDNIFMTCSSEHSRNYSLLAEKAPAKSYVPELKNPKDAFKEKASMVKRNCDQLGIHFELVVLRNRKPTPDEEDLRAYIIKKAIPNNTIIRNGSREPCSQGRELAIRSNGELYPHCFDIFNNTYRIGKIGLLIE